MSPKALKSREARFFASNAGQFASVAGAPVGRWVEPPLMLRSEVKPIINRLPVERIVSPFVTLPAAEAFS